MPDKNVLLEGEEPEEIIDAELLEDEEDEELVVEDDDDETESEEDLEDDVEDPEVEYGKTKENLLEKELEENGFTIEETEVVTLQTLKEDFTRIALLLDQLRVRVVFLEDSTPVAKKLPRQVKAGKKISKVQKVRKVSGKKLGRPKKVAKK